MLSFLRPGAPAARVPDNAVEATYYRQRVRALLGVFIGYAGYYFVRSNFTLSTPHLKADLHLSTTEIGLLSSCLLIAYGLSKGVMSSLADKADPKRFMALGLLLSVGVNLLLGFGTAFWMFAALVIANGIFQGMGAGPSFIVISKWFPRRQRGKTGALWNISHNIGGGMVAPIVGASMALLGSEHWQAASYWAPAVCATLVAFAVLAVGAGSPESEGLPALGKIFPEESRHSVVHDAEHEAAAKMTSFEIFRRYVMPNKNVWFISFVDVFVYLVRFGVITWLPIYLLQVKHFSKAEMGTAFAFFEWAAIPSTLLAGYLTDKFFKGNRMPLAIMAMCGIFVAIFFYWYGTSIAVVGAAAAAIGCLIFVPQFLASVQTIELVPSFAVGSATGLRGLMSYVLGSTMGTSLFGFLVDRFGWQAGFYLLASGVAATIFFCLLTHFGVKRMERAREEKLDNAVFHRLARTGT
jgi:OPA family phosphoglycerate-like MFS transporter